MAPCSQPTGGLGGQLVSGAGPAHPWVQAHPPLGLSGVGARVCACALRTVCLHMRRLARLRPLARALVCAFWDG